jgi:tetratricopeptide (TPR) repeat protein
MAQRQQWRLTRSEERVAIARRRAEHDSHARARTLVERLNDDHLRLTIELLALQAEQQPKDAAVRLELGRTLKRAANYSAAIAVLEESLRLLPDDPAMLVELGECRQHLRQFEAALASYLKAVSRAEREESEDVHLLAAYRAGVLAAAMGKNDVARSQLALVGRKRPDYRDVPERLAQLG